MTPSTLSLLLKKYAAIGLVPAAGLFVANQAQAGWLLEPSLKYNVLTFVPVAEEATPNYHAVGAGLAAGYSLRQIFDASAHFDLLPLHRNLPKPGVYQALAMEYGGGFAGRLGKALYLGFRGGMATYRFVDDTLLEHEVAGFWKGPSFGAAIGAIFPTTKQASWQMTVGYDHSILRAIDETAQSTGDERRRFDTFGLSLTYVLNSYENYGIDNSMFKSFLDSSFFHW